MSADRAKQKAKDTAEEVSASRPYQWLVRSGLVALGVVYLLIGYLAGQLAFGSQPDDASQSGALRHLATYPFGMVLISAVTLGFLVLTVWMILTLLIGLREFDGWKLWQKRGSVAGRAVVYSVLGFQAAQIVMGARQDGEEAQRSLTAAVLAMPLGQILVGIAGLIITGVGVATIVKGVRDKYNEDLQGTLSGFGKWAARIGHVAKGLGVGVVGLMFVLAAWNYDPDAAGGLDNALQNIRQAPYGRWLLLVVAVGFAWYGIYCFLWAKRPKFR